MKYFPPFRFDGTTGLLWRGGEQIALTRKAALLLECLVARPGTLVPHDLIMQVVWPDAHVQPENVKALVHELRVSIGDSAHSPVFIRSNPGRGYTFLASVTDAPPPFARASSIRTDTELIGRELGLAVLRQGLTLMAETGQSQIVLVEGPRGIGKTALCNAFVQHAKQQMVLRVTRGEGMEPVASAASTSVIQDALKLLSAQYPWLAPNLLARTRSSSDGPPPWALPQHGALSNRIAPIGISPRMVGEIMSALEELTRDVPLLLILEDLQWGDTGTIACLRGLARRQSGSSLCVVATYCRDGSYEIGEELERLGRDIKTQRRGNIVRLGPLSQMHVTQCIERRMGLRAANVVASVVCEATGGHPALVSKAIDVLHELEASTGSIADWSPDQRALALTSIVGESLQYQIDQLNANDRIVLETAAIIGPVFAAAEVAAGLDLRQVGLISRRLDELAARGMLIEASPSPRSLDGAPNRYRFRIAAAADLLVAPIPISRCSGIAAKSRRMAHTSPHRD